VSDRLATVRAHGRHLVLFSLAAGLILGPVSPAATLAAAAVAAGLAGRRAVALVAAGAVLGGAVLADARLAALDQGSLPSMHGQRWSGAATVLEPVRERGGGRGVARVRLEGLGEVAVARLRGEGAGDRVAWPALGAVVRLSGRIAPLGHYERYQRRRGALAAMEVDRFEATGAWRGGVAGALDRVRRRAESGLERGLPPPEAALLRGMVLGQDERLSDEVRTEFEHAGLAHLLAVSGQNVMLLAMLVLGFGALTGLGLRARLAAALVLVALYVPLAGAGPSIQRAGVMGGAGLIAALAGRPASRWYALGLAAVVTLALNPRASGEPGWQLSFAAVAGLMALVPGWRVRLRRARVPGPLSDVTAVTAAATLATAPLMAFHFEQVSLASLPANLVAAPAVAPVMWLGMLGIAAAQLSPALCEPLNWLNGSLLAYVEWVAHVAAAPEAASVPAHVRSPAGLAAAYAAGVAALACGPAAWRRWGPARGGWGWPASAAGGGAEGGARGGMPPRVKFAAAVAVTGLVALAALVLSRGSQLAGPRPGELVVSFLDVGQGDATLLQHDGAAILVDTGPPGGPILKRLAEAGVDRLDALLITHAQADHEGAALDVLRAYAPRLVLNGGAGWPTAVQRQLTRATPAYAGQAVTLGRIRLQLLWPPRPGPGWRPEGDPNGRAVVALARVGAFDLLLPADAEAEVTNPLDLPDVDALKVAHHGSADPGLPALLERTKPEMAAIEVGRGNSYGHPTPSTLAALHAAVPAVHRTDRDGTIRLRVRGGTATIERSGSRP